MLEQLAASRTIIVIASILSLICHSPCFEPIENALPALLMAEQSEGVSIQCPLSETETLRIKFAPQTEVKMHIALKIESDIKARHFDPRHQCA